MSIQTTLILQVLLILVNAFFAGTEIAVISLNSIQLRKDAEDKVCTEGEEGNHGAEEGCKECNESYSLPCPGF